MSDINQVRINELARELEVKAKAIIDLLSEYGVTEKKTHSSSIPADVAEKVRKRIQGTAEAEAQVEAQAEAAAKAEKEAKDAAAKAARMKPAAPAVPPQASAAPTAAKPSAPAVHPAPAARPAAPGAPAATSATPAVPKAPAPGPTVVPPAAKPAAPAAPATGAAAAAPLRPSVPTKPPTTPGGTRPAASAGTQPSAVRPATAAPGAVAARPGAPTRPGAPARPSATGNRGPLPTGNRGPLPDTASGSRSSGPRPGQRAPGRPGMLPPFPDKMPPKAEPGKPLYTRKAPQRQRPVIDKREIEGERKLHPTRQRPGAGRAAAAAVIAPPEPRPPRDVTVTEGITIRELAEKLDVRAKDLLKTLLDRGVFASINQALDVPTATTLAEAFSGVVSVVSLEEEMVLEVAKEETKESLKPRPPVVTVMGHVDHGKTSLLDAIRQADVAAGEAGGITQHIGAYKVAMEERSVVFIDTPGHEAFTRMRARGAKVTDIVVLVVAADDGVMPQTKEAIDHAKAAKVPIIVAVNKIDKPEAQPERVKRQLTELGLMPSEWGGETEFVEVSAKQKKGIDKLLEIILLVADLRELKANPDAPASGTVLESRVDRGRGPVATVLVQNGTLNAGDFFICGSVFGKVRAMFDDRGRVVNDAPPSTPVEVLGLQGVPDAGDLFQVTDEAKARHIVEYRQGKQRDAAMARISGSRITLDQLHEQLKAGDVKELGIVIKGDVQGSVEVLSEMLPKLSTDQVKLKIIGSGVGAVTENDVLLASASGAIVIAFGVRPDRKALDLAQQEHVDIRTHNIIYEVSDEIKKAMEGLLEPVVTETYLGRAEVRNTFRVKGAGTVAGCYVVDGILKRDAQVRVLREGVVIYTSKLNSLKRFKDDASEVRTGFECGAGVANFNDVKVGDILECFSVTKMSAAEAAGQGGGPAGKK